MPAAIAAVEPLLVVAALHLAMGRGEMLLWSMLGAAHVAGTGAELIARRRFLQRFEDEAAFERWVWRAARCN